MSYRRYPGQPTSLICCGDSYKILIGQGHRFGSPKVSPTVSFPGFRVMGMPNPIQGTVALLGAFPWPPIQDAPLSKARTYSGQAREPAHEVSLPEAGIDSRSWRENKRVMAGIPPDSGVLPEAEDAAERTRAWPWVGVTRLLPGSDFHCFP